MTNKFLILILISLILTLAQTNKPDLIIEWVSSSIINEPIKIAPGQPVSGGDRHSFIEYTITIKNIGTKDFSDAFYISWSNNSSDIKSGHYSGTSMVNKDKNIISIGKSLNVTVKVYNSSYSSRSKKFLINTDGKPHLKTSLPFIEELNYDNNSYMY